MEFDRIVTSLSFTKLIQAHIKPTVSKKWWPIGPISTLLIGDPNIYKFAINASYSLTDIIVITKCSANMVLA